MFRELLVRGHREKRLGIAGAHSILSILRDIVEKRIHLIKILLRNGIVFVIMTLRARHGHAKPSHTRGGYSVHDVKVQVFLLDESTLVTRHHIAVKTRGDFLVHGGLRQHVPRDLFDGKLVKGHPRIERLDNPFAPKPHVPQGIVVIAAGVPITRQIEPWHREPLSKMRRSQQFIHGCGKRRIPVLGRGRHECIHLRHGRWQAR